MSCVDNSSDLSRHLSKVIRRHEGTHRNYCCHPWSHQESHRGSFASSIPACNITWSLYPWAGDLQEGKRERTRATPVNKYIKNVTPSHQRFWSCVKKKDKLHCTQCRGTVVGNIQLQPAEWIGGDLTPIMNPTAPSLGPWCVRLKLLDFVLSSSPNRELIYIYFK